MANPCVPEGGERQLPGGSPAFPQVSIQVLWISNDTRVRSQLLPTCHKQGPTVAPSPGSGLVPTAREQPALGELVRLGRVKPHTKPLYKGVERDLPGWRSLGLG